MFLTILAQTPDATTTGTSPGGGGGLGGLVIFLPLLLFFFWTMRKQGRQRREHMAMLDTIEPGDEVETVAGMFGIVKRTTPTEVFVELAPGLEVKMSRGAVRRKVIAVPDEPPAGEGS